MLVHLDVEAFGCSVVYVYYLNADSFSHNALHQIATARPEDGFAAKLPPVNASRGLQWQSGHDGAAGLRVRALPRGAQGQAPRRARELRRGHDVRIRHAVVTGPARPKNARSLSATNRDEPRTPKYISETLNSFSTSLVPCKTTSRKRARARAAENTKKIK